MYEWYCKDKPSLPLCTQHKAAQDLSVASDPTARAQLLEKLKTTKPDKGAIQKDYLAMKTSWCAGPGTTTKSPLCMMPAQRFQTGAGNPARTALSDSQEPMAWYCSKPARGEEAVCKRAEIFKKLRTPGTSATDRTALLASLKTNPAPPYGTIQGIYTDWCRQTGNADKPICVRTRTQAGQEKMTKFYCDKAANADDLWCKRTAILKQLKSATAEERKGLISQLSKITPSGSSTQISASMAKAKQQYCAQSSAAATEVICKSAPPSTLRRSPSSPGPSSGLRRPTPGLRRLTSSGRSALPAPKGATARSPPAAKGALSSPPRRKHAGGNDDDA